MLPKDPGKVIVQAHSLGLKALVNLLRERTIKETHYLYTDAKNRLDKAMDHWYNSRNQNKPDFSYVAALEKKQYLDTIRNAGFRDITIASESTYDIDVSQELKGKITSVLVEAIKKVCNNLM